jgi:mono/diheme cytochrome c family protein
MRKLLALSGVLVLVVAFVAATEADARPQYQKQFQAKYKKVTGAKKAKCNVCHRKKQAGEKGKPRNDYGVALKKLIPKKNCKDVKKILKALTDAEKVKVSKDKKEKETYGDRLKAGKLPATPPKKK